MIKLQIIGHLGKNAVENFANGKAVLNFSVAHNQRYKNAQGVQQERTVWADCALWGPNAIGPYLLQGTHVFVEGTPYIELYNNGEGLPAAALKLRVTNVQLLSAAPKSVGEEKTGGEETGRGEKTDVEGEAGDEEDTNVEGETDGEEETDSGEEADDEEELDGIEK